MPSLSDKKILKLQIGCGNKRGTEKTAHSFRNLVGQYYNPERGVFCLKNRPNNAFNYLNRETTLNQVFFQIQQSGTDTLIARTVKLVFLFTELYHFVRKRNSTRRS